MSSKKKAERMLATLGKYHADAAARIEDVKKQREVEGFVCKQCGRCCLALTKVSIYPQDIERWKKEGRDDLYSPEMMKEWDSFGSSGLFDNQRSERCPFLRKRGKKYSCKLGDTKPIVCQLFPESREHAERHCNCPGYD